MIALQFYLVLMTACIISCDGRTYLCYQPSDTPACQPSQQCPSCPICQPSLQCPACPDFAMNHPIDCSACTYSQSVPVCSDSPVGLIPIPNIKASMLGFNPILSNPNKQPDPGLKGQIFEPYTQLKDGRVILSPFITKALANQHCTQSFAAKTMKNYNDYRQKTSSYSFDAEAGFRASADSWLASFSSSFDNDELKIRKFFQEAQGEIVMSINECRTHTIEVASYVTPRFTRSFEEGLKSLHYAAIEPNSMGSKNTYIRFISIFGTHYLKTTHLGAKLIFEKRFTTRSKSGEEEERRKNCVQVSASGSVGGRNVFIGSAEVSFSTNMHRCSDSTSGSSYLTDNGIQADKVTSIGSLPSKDPEAWARNIVDSVPISFELKPLSALFEFLNFDFVSFKSGDTSSVYFNGSAVRRFFDDMSSDYCRLVLGIDCRTTTTGCGVNSLCSSEEDCENDSTLPLGHRCVRRYSETTMPPPTTTPAVGCGSVIRVCSSEEDCVDDPTLPLGHRCVRRYGGVVIAGGIDNGLEELSSTETIETHHRPSLPVKIFGLSLVFVRHDLYACGGKTYIDSDTRSNRCYTLVPDAAVWSETVRLPVAMSHHTAVTVGHHIWFVYESHLYSLNTTANKFHKHTLPFTAKYHCAVSNRTHSYIVGAGSAFDQVWVNKEASSPTQWQRVATLPRHGRGMACLWPTGSSIVVTGGGGYAGSVYTSLLNTANNTVTEVADMQLARAWHKMLVLDGKPAVVAGSYLDPYYGEEISLNSTVTYNAATNKWQRHALTLHTARNSFGLAQL